MFTGRRLDPETRTGSRMGLYYYRARMYAPELGRFMQTDPIGYYDSMNLYQYCGNNPVNWIDPWGLSRGLTAKARIKVVVNGKKISKIIRTEKDLIGFLKGLSEKGKIITHFEYVGHTPDGEYLYYGNGEEGHFVTGDDIANMMGEGFGRYFKEVFSEDGVIILRGCQTARRPGESICYQFKEHYPNARVFGYDGNAYPIGTTTIPEWRPWKPYSDSVFIEVENFF